MKTSMEIDRWVARKKEEIARISMPRKLLPQPALQKAVEVTKERCVGMLAAAVDRAKALSLETTMFQTALYDINEELIRLEDQMPMFSGEEDTLLLRHLTMDLSYLTATQLRQSIIFLRGTVQHYRKCLDDYEIQYNVLYGRLRRKDRVINEVRKTLWAEVVMLREQLYQRDHQGYYDERVFSIFDFLALVDEEDQARHTNEEHIKTIRRLKDTSEAERKRLVQQHENEVSKLKEEIEDLTKENAGLKSGLLVLADGTDLSKITRENELRQGEYLEMVSELQKRVTVLEGLLESKEAIISRQSNELETILTENDESLAFKDQRILELQKHLDDQLGIIADLKAEIERTNTRLEQEMELTKELKEEKLELHRRNAELERRVDDEVTEAKMAAAKVRKAMIEREAAWNQDKETAQQAQQELAVANEREAAMAYQVKELEVALESAKAEVAALQGKVQVLEEARNDLIEERKGLQAAFDDTQSKTARQNIKIVQLENSVTRLQTELEDALSRCKATENLLEQTRTDMEQETKTLAFQVDQNLNIIRELREALDRQRERSEESSVSNSDLKAAYNTLKRDTTREIKRLERELRISEAATERANKQKAAVEEQSTALQGLLDQRERELAESKAAHGDTRNELAATAEELKRAKWEIDSKASKVESLSAELAKMREMLEVQKAKNSALSEHLKESKQRHEAVLVRRESEIMDRKRVEMALKDVQDRLDEDTDAMKDTRVEMLEQIKDMLHRHVSTLRGGQESRRAVHDDLVQHRRNEAVAVARWAGETRTDGIDETVEEFGGVVIGKGTFDLVVGFPSALHAAQWAVSVTEVAEVAAAVAYGPAEGEQGITVAKARVVSREAPMRTVLLTQEAGGAADLLCDKSAALLGDAIPFVFNSAVNPASKLVVLGCGAPKDTLKRSLDSVAEGHPANKTSPVDIALTPLTQADLIVPPPPQKISAAAMIHRRKVLSSRPGSGPPSRPGSGRRPSSGALREISVPPDIKVLEEVRDMLLDVEYLVEITTADCYHAKLRQQRLMKQLSRTQGELKRATKRILQLHALGAKEQMKGEVPPLPEPPEPPPAPHSQQLHETIQRQSLLIAHLQDQLQVFGKEPPPFPSEESTVVIQKEESGIETIDIKVGPDEPGDASSHPPIRLVLRRDSIGVQCTILAGGGTPPPPPTSHSAPPLAIEDSEPPTSPPSSSPTQGNSYSLNRNHHQVPLGEDCPWVDLPIGVPVPLSTYKRPTGQAGRSVPHRPLSASTTPYFYETGFEPSGLLDHVPPAKAVELPRDAIPKEASLATRRESLGTVRKGHASPPGSPRDMRIVDLAVKGDRFKDRSTAPHGVPVASRQLVNVAVSEKAAGGKQQACEITRTIEALQRIVVPRECDTSEASLTLSIQPRAAGVDVTRYALPLPPPGEPAAPAKGSPCAPKEVTPDYYLDHRSDLIQFERHRKEADGKDLMIGSKAYSLVRGARQSLRRKSNAQRWLATLCGDVE